MNSHRALATYDAQRAHRTRADSSDKCTDVRRICWLGAKTTGKDDFEITSYVLNHLGAESLQTQLRTLLTVEDFDQQVGVHLEGTSARFRRGQVSWVDVIPEVEGCFRGTEGVR